MFSNSVLFVIPSLNQGGAERVVSVMANYWAKRNCSISVIVFNERESFYPLIGEVKLFKLNSASNRFGLLSFLVNNLNRTRRYIANVRSINPDIIISFTDNANVYCILYNFFFRRPLIITQRTNPRNNTLPRVIRWLPGIIYKSASAMVVQTSETISIYNEQKIKLPTLTEIIFNPLSPDIHSPRTNEKRQNIIFAVGRLLNRDKNFDKLIDCFSACENLDWQLHIAGEGRDKDLLSNKIIDLKLSKQVKLLGPISDLRPYYQKAKIFALTSQFEGFPNVLCEAMANGCACISFNCPTGPSEIINHGVNGILIENGNYTEYITELRALMEDTNKIEKLAEEGAKIQAVLDEGKIIQQWENLINNILTPKL